MTEMLMASWDNQEWPGERAAGPGLRRPRIPQQGVELPTEMGQEGGGSLAPQPRAHSSQNLQHRPSPAL